MDWKDLVKEAAPTLGAVLTTAGGPVGALAGGAINLLANALTGSSTGDPVKDEAAVAQALAGGLTPELRAKLIDADTQIKQAGITFETRKLEVNAETEKAYIADVADARKTNGEKDLIIVLGLMINVFSYALVGAVLYGCFALMHGQGLGDIDPGIAATVGAVVGGVVQWLMSNAAQANGFFFGSSPGSRQLARDLGNAVGGAVGSGAAKPAAAPRGKP